MAIDSTQYLFRVHHSPIGGPTPAWLGNPFAPLVVFTSQVELSHTDYLCSLPNSTTDLTQMATQLAMADACLLVNCYIVCIAVFNLSPDKSADEQTPVAVFHPFNSSPVTPARSQYDAHSAAIWRPVRLENDFYEDYREQPTIYFDGFKTYDLVDQRPALATGGQPTDEFFAACIARETVTGRPQLRMSKRAVEKGDWHYTDVNSICLNMGGTLARARYPAWDRIIEFLPWSHSGYKVEESGQLSPRAIAQTRRVLNGISNLSQQRRMQQRRTAGPQRLSLFWMRGVKELMSWARLNDIHGRPRCQPLKIATYSPETLTYTRVPWQLMKKHFLWATRFINAAYISSGNGALMLPLPEWDAVARNQEWYRIYGEFRGYDYSFQPVYMRGETKNLEVLIAATDLLGDCIRRIFNFERALAVAKALPRDVAYPIARARAVAVVTIYQDFAEQWPKLQRDFLGVLFLFMTWELTWDVRERSRATAEEGGQRTPMPPLKPVGAQWMQPLPSPTVGKMPDFMGRFVTDQPLMTPFRLWPVSLCGLDSDDLELEQEELERQDEERKKQDEIDVEDELRREKRKKKRLEEIEDLEKERIKQHVPNPEDPWDYRNLSNPDYWSGRMLEPVTKEFAQRALDIPDELDYVSNVFGGKKLPPGALGAVAEGAKPGEVVTAFYAPVHKIIGPAAIRRIVIPTPTGIAKAVAVEIIEGVAQEIVGGKAGDDPVYSDRQVWPE